MRFWDKHHWYYGENDWILQTLKHRYDEQHLNFEVHVQQALDTPREACLQLKWNQDKSAWTPLVVTYHPTLPSLSSTTRPHLPILQASKQLQRAFPLPPLIAFQRPRNLRDFLVRVALTSTPQEPPGNYLCGALRRKTCTILSATDEFSIHTTGQHFNIKINASCRSSNVIYLHVITGVYVQEVWPAVCRRDRTTTLL